MRVVTAKIPPPFFFFSEVGKGKPLVIYCSDLLLSFIFSKKKRFIYLRGRVQERQKEIFHLLIRSSHGLTSLGLGQREGQSLPVRLGLRAGGRGPSTCAIFCCFPRHISSKLDQKRIQAGFKLMLIWDVGIAGGRKLSSL